MVGGPSFTVLLAITCTALSGGSRATREWGGSASEAAEEAAPVPVPPCPRGKFLDDTGAFDQHPKHGVGWVPPSRKVLDFILGAYERPVIFHHADIPIVSSGYINAAPWIPAGAPVQEMLYATCGHSRMKGALAHSVIAIVVRKLMGTPKIYAGVSARAKQRLEKAYETAEGDAAGKKWRPGKLRLSEVKDEVVDELTTLALREAQRTLLSAAVSPCLERKASIVAKAAATASLRDKAGDHWVNSRISIVDHWREESDNWYMVCPHIGGLQEAGGGVDADAPQKAVIGTQRWGGLHASQQAGRRRRVVTFGATPAAASALDVAAAKKQAEEDIDANVDVDGNFDSIGGRSGSRRLLRGRLPTRAPTKPRCPTIMRCMQLPANCKRVTSAARKADGCPKHPCGIPKCTTALKTKAPTRATRAPTTTAKPTRAPCPRPKCMPPRPSCTVAKNNAMRPNGCAAYPCGILTCKTAAAAKKQTARLAAEQAKRVAAVREQVARGQKRANVQAKITSAQTRVPLTTRAPTKPRRAARGRPSKLFGAAPASAPAGNAAIQQLRQQQSTSHSKPFAAGTVPAVKDNGQPTADDDDNDAGTVTPSPTPKPPTPAPTKSPTPAPKAKHPNKQMEILEHASKVQHYRTGYEALEVIEQNVRKWVDDSRICTRTESPACWRRSIREGVYAARTAIEDRIDTAVVLAAMESAVDFVLKRTSAQAASSTAATVAMLAIRDEEPAAFKKLHKALVRSHSYQCVRCPMGKFSTGTGPSCAVCHSRLGTSGDGTICATPSPTPSPTPNPTPWWGRIKHAHHQNYQSRRRRVMDFLNAMEEDEDPTTAGKGGVGESGQNGFLRRTFAGRRRRHNTPAPTPVDAGDDDEQSGKNQW